MSPQPPGRQGPRAIEKDDQWYLAQGQLRVDVLRRGTGIHDILLDAGNFVATIERRQGLKIAPPEEIAYRLNLIDEEQLLRLAEPMLQTDYGRYLMKLVTEGKGYISE
jgi:glucose-1-phosphate thymidylyltransferase